MTYYSLRRLADGTGHIGELSASVSLDSHGRLIAGIDSRPQVGASHWVGSHLDNPLPRRAGWLTTPIVRIVLDQPNRVVFLTASGSQYEWSAHDEIVSGHG